MRAKLQDNDDVMYRHIAHAPRARGQPIAIYIHTYIDTCTYIGTANSL